MGVSPSIVAWSGRMGGDWLDGFEFEQRKESPKESTAQDTSNLVHDLLEAEVDVILYAGGDGTTRDIVNALDGNETPLIGVPGGVKMHSGCFATTPKASAEVLLAFLQGDLMVAITEVMDLDEETYQKGMESTHVWRSLDAFKPTIYAGGEGTSRTCIRIRYNRRISQSYWKLN